MPRLRAPLLRVCWSCVFVAECFEWHHQPHNGPSHKPPLPVLLSFFFEYGQGGFRLFPPYFSLATQERKTETTGYYHFYCYYYFGSLEAFQFSPGLFAPGAPAPVPSYYCSTRIYYCRPAPSWDWRSVIFVFVTCLFGCCYLILFRAVSVLLLIIICLTSCALACSLFDSRYFLSLTRSLA